MSIHLPNPRKKQPKILLVPRVPAILSFSLFHFNPLRLPLLGLCFLGFLLPRLHTRLLTRLLTCLFLCLSSVAGLV